MKFLILTGLLSAFSAFAACRLCEGDLEGQYSIIGNQGFLSYQLTINAHGFANVLQTMMDGSYIQCDGKFQFSEATQAFSARYSCPAGNTLIQDISFQGISLAELRKGAHVKMHIRSSAGSEANVIAWIKKN